MSKVNKEDLKSATTEEKIEVLKLVEDDIESIDKRISRAEESLATIELNDYNTLSSMQGVINRMQGEKTSLVKLKHSINQDINVRNPEVESKIEKLNIEIDRLASGGDLSKIDLVISSLQGLADAEDEDEDKKEDEEDTSDNKDDKDRDSRDN